MNYSPRHSLDLILNHARQLEGSDIHLVSGLPPAMRVAGEILVASNWEPLTNADIDGMVDALLSEDQKLRLREKRELSVSCIHGGGRIRASLYHRIGGVELAIRMCSAHIKSAEELRLPEVIDDMVQRSSGLILVVGPTGAGKTTTLNYMIDTINATRRCRIITIEDPVEYQHAHRKSVVTQIEVGTDTHDFSHCLRHVLRLDPDVIAIGEMRDLETISTALTAAETGHLVLATLHTPSTMATAERIIGTFEGGAQAQIAYQLSSSLIGVVAQRLVPCVSGDERVLATEVMVANSAIRTQIREGNYHHMANVITSNRNQGMHMMESSLVTLYQEGRISLDQAYVHANSLELMDMLLNRHA